MKLVSELFYTLADQILGLGLFSSSLSKQSQHTDPKKSVTPHTVPWGIALNKKANKQADKENGNNVTLPGRLVKKLKN